MAGLKHLSLFELQAQIKSAVERAIPLSQWVVAEVSELRVNASGHCYMQLVEKSARGGSLRAAASAVAWRSSWGSIAAHFRATAGSDITPGMQLLLKVSASYHELYGFSLVVSDIDPAYTIGEIIKERDRIIAQLQQEGVWEMNRRLPIAVPARRIAIVSSASAAGFQDFMQELERSPWQFETTLFEALMQGEAAEDSIIAALEAIADRAEEFEVVVMVRGGGAASDLKCFDGYRLSAHVAQFPLPILTGIGHDKDRSIVDMVAAAMLKTPTAVAGFLIERMVGEDARLADLGARVEQAALRLLSARQARLEYLAGRIEASDPQRILALGFAIVRADGRAIRGKVAPKTNLEITLQEGSIDAVAL